MVCRELSDRINHILYSSNFLKIFFRILKKKKKPFQEIRSWVMLASPKASACPQFPSAEHNQNTYEAIGHVSLLPRWCRHCTPPALLQLPVSLAGTGVIHSRREGTQDTVSTALPTHCSPSRAGHGGNHSSVALKAGPAAAGPPASAVGTANRPSAGAHLEGSLAPAVPTRQLLPCHSPRAVQPASLSHARPVSLSRAANWLGWASCGRAHTCVP